MEQHITPTSLTIYSTHDEESERVTILIDSQLASVYPTLKLMINDGDTNSQAYPIPFWKTSHLLSVKKYVETGDASEYERELFEYFSLIPDDLRVGNSLDNLPREYMVVRLREIWHLDHPHMPVPPLIEQGDFTGVKGDLYDNLNGTILFSDGPEYNDDASVFEYSPEYLCGVGTFKDLLPFPWTGLSEHIPSLVCTLNDDFASYHRMDQDAEYHPAFFHIIDDKPVDIHLLISQVRLAAIKCQRYIIKVEENPEYITFYVSESVYYDQSQKPIILHINKTTHRTLNHLLYTISSDIDAWAMTSKGGFATERCVMASITNTNVYPYRSYSNPYMHNLNVLYAGGLFIYVPSVNKKDHKNLSEKEALDRSENTFHERTDTNDPIVRQYSRYWVIDSYYSLSQYEGYVAHLASDN